MTRKSGRTALVIVMCAWALSGCAKEETAHQQSEPGSHAQGGPAPSTTTAQDAPSGTTAGEVHLAGTLGCGHCTYHVTAECSPCLKTTAGEVYVIDGVEEGSELMEKRFDGLQIAVVGSVIGSEDPKHIAMTSFEWK